MLGRKKISGEAKMIQYTSLFLCLVYSFNIKTVTSHARMKEKKEVISYRLMRMWVLSGFSIIDPTYHNTAVLVFYGIGMRQ